MGNKALESHHQTYGGRHMAAPPYQHRKETETPEQELERLTEHARLVVRACGIIYEKSPLPYYASALRKIRKDFEPGAMEDITRAIVYDVFGVANHYLWLHTRQELKDELLRSRALNASSPLSDFYVIALKHLEKLKIIQYYD